MTDEEEERARLADEARMRAVEALEICARMSGAYTKDEREIKLRTAEAWAKIYHADVLRGG